MTGENVNKRRQQQIVKGWNFRFGSMNLTAPAFLKVYNLFIVGDTLRA
jgi:hypothetical protein